MSQSPDDLFTYKQGTLSVGGLNDAITETWLEIRDDPAARLLIAERLGLGAEFFGSEEPPFGAEVRTSGLDGGLLAIFVVKAVAGGVLAKLGAEGVEVLKKLWTSYFQRKVSPPGMNNVGDKVDG